MKIEQICSWSDSNEHILKKWKCFKKVTMENRYYQKPVPWNLNWLFQDSQHSDFLTAERFIKETKCMRFWENKTKKCFENIRLAFQDQKYLIFYLKLKRWSVKSQFKFQKSWSLYYQSNQFMGTLVGKMSANHIKNTTHTCTCWEIILDLFVYDIKFSHR